MAFIYNLGDRVIYTPSFLKDTTYPATVTGHYDCDVLIALDDGPRFRVAVESLSPIEDDLCEHGHPMATAREKCAGCLTEMEGAEYVWGDA